VILDTPTLWLILGFIGQGLFAGRFLWQWLASEKAKKSVIPLPFWYLSIAGGAILLVYAIYKQDPVFICGQATGLLVYARNLFLIRNERRHKGTLLND
jgi:lipid-A-disaccharide synthase-like uncharacterized protein